MKLVFKSDKLSVSDIYNHIDDGVPVYWGSLRYTIIKEITEHNEYTLFSKKGEYCLMIKCNDNGSKTLLEKSAIGDCFVNIQ